MKRLLPLCTHATVIVEQISFGFDNSISGNENT